MNNSTKSILLVDDDQDYKYFFYKALEQVAPDIKITTAVDGKDALEKLSGFAPDMIILDFNMPRMNGMLFLKEIQMRDDVKGIPIIIYSTFISMFDANELKKLGASQVLTKPVGFADTVTMVSEILNINPLQNCA